MRKVGACGLASDAVLPLACHATCSFCDMFGLLFADCLDAFVWFRSWGGDAALPLRLTLRTGWSTLDNQRGCLP